MTASASVNPDLRGFIVDTAIVRYLGDRLVELPADLVLDEADTSLAVAMNPPAIAVFELPDPSTLSDIPGSKRLRFFDSIGQAGAYNILINATGGALIDGVPQISIVGNWGAVEVEWRGTYWHAASTFNVMTLGGVFGLDGQPTPVDADSDEFNAEELSADWALGSNVALDPDPPARGETFSGPALVRISTTQRPGWLLLQPSDDNPGALFHKPLAAPLANGFLYLKFSMDSNENIPASDVFQFGIFQTTTSLGEIIPDLDNCVVIGLARDTSDNSWNLVANYKVAGVGATLYDKTLDSFTQPFTRMAVGRDGTNFRVYVGSESGGFKHVGSFSGAINPDRVAFVVNNNSAPAGVYGIDYVRRIDGVLPTV